MRRPTETPLSALALAALALTLTLTSGCVAYSGNTPAQKTQSWASQGSLVANNAQIVDDVHKARLAVARGTAIQLRTICSGLEFDVGTAYDTLPTPDLALTNDLNVADEQLLHAASDCSQVSSVSSPRTRRALAQMATGLGDLQKAQRRARALGVSWPGTL